jgi:ParB family chromosome partitioning protein
MSGLDAWETMAWRTRLQDGVVPGSSGSGDATWIDTDEMLACPRSRSSSWAGLGTMATVPVVHPDGRVMAVLELARREQCPADHETLARLTGVAVRLAERIAAVEEELAAQGPRWELSPR